MDDSVLNLIDLRSFSSLWFWIVVALAWSGITHSALGVPFDMVLRARRRGGQHMADLEALVDIQIRRRMTVLQAAGGTIVLVWTATVTMTFILGFGYGLELAQALALLLVPMTLVFALRGRLMARLAGGRLRGEALCRALTWHRLGVQGVGLAAILVTTLWGMWFNLNLRTLGG